MSTRRHKLRAAAFAFGIAAMMLTSMIACMPREPRTVSLRVRGGVPDASVTIDDMYVGSLATVSHRGVALPPGKHRITVERAGYFPWDQLVEAKEGDAPIHLNVSLTPIPD